MRRLALLLLLAQSAYACECRVFSANWERRHAKFVFRGTITSISATEIAFTVHRVWKGKVPPTFTLPHILSPGPCFAGFAPSIVKPGAELLVYAWESPQLTPQGCSHTTTIDRAASDLRQLGPGRRP